MPHIAIPAMRQITNGFVPRPFTQTQELRERNGTWESLWRKVIWTPLGDGEEFEWRPFSMRADET